MSVLYYVLFPVGAFCACYPLTATADQIGWTGAFRVSAVLSAMSVIPLYYISRNRVLRATAE